MGIFIILIIIIVSVSLAYEASLPHPSVQPIVSPSVSGYVPTSGSPEPSSSPNASGSPSPSSSPSSSGGSMTVDIYAGEMSSSSYGFGTSAGSITSPGPTLTFTSSQTVTLNFHNVGQMPHNFAIVDSKSSTATVLWSAQIQSASNPVSPENTASVTFTVGSAGSYYYICQVDAHVTLGMWGTVTVN